jgi:hypothetical protein
MLINANRPCVLLLDHPAITHAFYAPSDRDEG